MQIVSRTAFWSPEGRHCQNAKVVLVEAGMPVPAIRAAVRLRLKVLFELNHLTLEIE